MPNLLKEFEDSNGGKVEANGAERRQKRREKGHVKRYMERF